MVTTRRSAILGPDGQPVEVASLDQEVAGATASGQRAVLGDTMASGLTPERLARILRAAQSGDSRAYLTLAIDMEERYLHYGAQLQTRRLALEAIDPTVTAPAGTPAPIIDFVRALVDDPRFRDAIGVAGDAYGKGYAVNEIMWDYVGGRLRPVDYIERDQRFFRYDRVAQRELLLVSDDAPHGSPLPPGKFLTHEPRLRGGPALRRGLARPAAWAWLIQSFTQQDWAVFAENFGVPLRIGKYPKSATDQDKVKLLRALKAMANDAAAVIREDMSVDLVAVNAAQGEKVFGALMDRLDKQVSKIVLGQTMTADDGASLGQAKIHNEVRIDILRADARQMATTVDHRLIRWAVAMNFGPQDRYPSVEWPVSEPEDIKALSEALDRTVKLGLRVSQKEIRDKFGLSEPEEGEEVLIAPKAEATPALPAPARALPAPRLALHVRGCLCEACAPRLAAQGEAAPREGDEIDALVDAEMGEWRRIAEPLLEEVFAQASEAASYDEMLARLDALRLDSRPLVEALARAMLTARGIGDVVDVPTRGLKRGG